MEEKEDEETLSPYVFLSDSTRFSPPSRCAIVHS